MNYGTIIEHKETIAPRSYSQSGYGNKLPTGHKVRLEGDTRILWRRVYVICYSNCATYYCIVNGDKVFLNL